MAITYRLNFNNSWKQKSRANLSKGLARMMTAIHAQAVTNAPYLTGALRNSGRFQRLNDMEYEVVFGSQRVPYAALRERENHLHPQTTHYLERAAKQESARAEQYFKDVA